MGRRCLRRAVHFSSEPPKYGWGRCPGCGSTVEPLDGCCFVCGCPATWRQIERSGQRVNALHPLLTRTVKGEGYNWE